MRQRWFWLAVWFLVMSVAAPAFAWDLNGSMERWDTAPWRPYDIAVLSDGSAWLTHRDSLSPDWPTGALVSVDPATGTVTPHQVPDAWGDSGFQMIDRAPGDILWIADEYDRIVRFDPATNTFTPYPLPAATFDLPASPLGIRVAPDGIVWFTCWGSYPGPGSGPAIGSYDPATNSWEAYPVEDGANDGLPVDIAFSGDGTVWFTTKTGGDVQGLGSLDPGTGTVILRPIVGGIDPFGILVSAGDVWFLDHHYDFGNGGLIRYDIGGDSFEYFPVPAELQDPHFLVMDPDGLIWLTAFAAPAIGTFDPATGTFAHRALPAGASPMGIALFPSGEIWWAETRDTLHGGAGRIRGLLLPFFPIDQDVVGVPAVGATGMAIFGLALGILAVWSIRRRGMTS